MDKHNGATKEMMTMMIMVKKVPWVMKNMEKIIFSPVFYWYEQDWGLRVSYARKRLWHSSLWRDRQRVPKPLAHLNASNSVKRDAIWKLQIIGSNMR